MIWNLTETQKREVVSALQAMDDEDIEFVVLRRHEHLPESVPGSQEKKLDVDILIKEGQFDEAVSILKSIDFNKRGSNGSPDAFVKMLAKGIVQPKRALRLLLYDRGKLEELIYKRTGRALSLENTPYDAASREGYAYLVETDETILDLKSHLSHKSPLNSKHYRLDPDVESKMFSRKQSNELFYFPHPVDELAHLIGHCVYDYNGKFSLYYQERCAELWSEIHTDEQYIEQFEEILGKVFYDANGVVLEAIENEKPNEIFGRLKSYAQY